MTLGDFTLNFRESRQKLYGRNYMEREKILLVSLSAVSNNASLLFHTVLCILSGQTKEGWYNMAAGRMQHERLIDVKY